MHQWRQTWHIDLSITMVMIDLSILVIQHSISCIWVTLYIMEYMAIDSIYIWPSMCQNCIQHHTSPDYHYGLFC